MPVASFIANASGGSALADLQDAQSCCNYFATLLPVRLAAQSYKDETIRPGHLLCLNPDFRALQQGPYGLYP